MTNKAEREIFRKSYGEVIKALADIVANAPQTDEQCEAELIPRPYVMDRVIQIREAMDTLSKLWQARAQASGVPDGWKLVPVEPTQEMLNAVDCVEVGGCCYSCTKWFASESDCKNIWAPMLAAAPIPPKSASATDWMPCRCFTEDQRKLCPDHRRCSIITTQSSDKNHKETTKSASVPVERLEQVLSQLSSHKPGRYEDVTDDIIKLIAEYKA
jgi:hypothetical protein